MEIIKRDKSKQKIDFDKIIKSITAAGANIKLAKQILNNIKQYIKKEGLTTLSVEDVSDLIENMLMENDHESAKRFIIYRFKRNEARRKRKNIKLDKDAIANYIHFAKYSRYIPKEKRRETYLESSHRSKNMHIKKFPMLSEEIEINWKFVDNKRVLPSMRSLQFAGPAIESHNARIFNCSATLIDRPEAFNEIFYLLLCGCGVGYSVQFPHIDKLPALSRIDKNYVVHFSIPDTIEGWSDSVKEIVNSYVVGYYVEFDYSKIRPKGSILKTGGGKAPGHLPLKNLLDTLKILLDKSQGRQLRPIECHDIICHIAEAVLSGGIRRSSLIALFSHDDGEMMYAKSQENFNYNGLNNQRAMANNSVVLLRNTTYKDQFLRIMNINQQCHGEPGVFFTNDINCITNPCSEIALMPYMEDNDKTGFAFCNLTEINCSVCENENDFYDAVKAASFIGTLQASYTNFQYLSNISAIIAKREALLGVSLTGIMDNPDIALNPEVLQKAARIAEQENKRVANLIGINPATRITTVKPSGTASLALGCIGSGIHPHHARRYFRRITANPLESVAQYFKSINPHMVEIKPNGDWCLIFPVEVSDKAITVKTQPALKFLENILSVYKNWVLPGTIDTTYTKNTHNVSATISFKKEEWNELLEEIWKHKNEFSALSFLPFFSDKTVPFMPREEVTTEEDENKWQHILKNYTLVDYTKLIEEEDNSKLIQELACAGGSCDL